MTGDSALQLGVTLLEAAFAGFQVSCYNCHHFNLTRLQKMTCNFQLLKLSQWKSVGKNAQRVKIEIEGAIRPIPDFNYLGNVILETKQDIELKIQKYNKINGAIKIHCGKPMTQNNVHKTIPARPHQRQHLGTVQKFILNEKYTRKLEAPQMRFLRPFRPNQVG
jgi:hypothetical protein